MLPADRGPVVADVSEPIAASRGVMIEVKAEPVHARIAADSDVTRVDRVERAHARIAADSDAKHAEVAGPRRRSRAASGLNVPPQIKNALK